MFYTFTIIIVVINQFEKTVLKIKIKHNFYYTFIVLHI